MKLLNGILKWILNLALALSAGLLVIIFLSSKPELNAYLLRLIQLAAVGLTSGLVARELFRRIPPVIIIIFSMLSSLLAVLAIDHFYTTTYQLQFLENDFSLRTPTLSDGSQFLLMTL
ncbi:MAG: hypothetical protein MUO42_02965, partial [Anaerolineaceae bacterium]|nr:hypothetical protein [Anaerolineaceae bacterium]